MDRENWKGNWKHGLCTRSREGKRHPLFQTWCEMRYRCENTEKWQYKYYGGKGVQVCERWQRFENFVDDMGERPTGHTLDRIDRNGNYEPENCRWATRQQQMNNHGNNRYIFVNGESMTVAEASRRLDLAQRNSVCKAWCFRLGRTNSGNRTRSIYSTREGTESMTTGEHRHLNMAIVWESARNLAGWSSTSQVAEKAGKVIPYYPVKCCADVLRNLKQRGLILHKPATPGANTAGQKGCSRWRVDPVMTEPEWRQGNGQRDPKKGQVHPTLQPDPANGRRQDRPGGNLALRHPAPPASGAQLRPQVHGRQGGVRNQQICHERGVICPTTAYCVGTT